MSSIHIPQLEKTAKEKLPDNKVVLGKNVMQLAYEKAIKNKKTKR